MKTNVKIDFISFKNGLSLSVFYLTRLGPAITYQTQYKKQYPRRAAGLWHRTVWQEVNTVSEEHPASILKPNRLV